MSRSLKGGDIMDSMILAVMAVVLLCLMAYRTAFAGRVHEFLSLLYIWAIHAAIAAVISFPVVFFGRRRMHVNSIDLLSLVLPFAIWTLLMNIRSSGKSISNLIEPVLFCFAIPLGALARVIIGSNIGERACSIIMVFILCIASACVYFWMPSLPE